MCTPNDNHVWMIEGEMVKVPIRVARALVKPHKNLIPLCIINTNLTPVKLYKGFTLAHVECVDEASIDVVSQKAEEKILQLSATDCASHTSYDYVEDMRPKTSVKITGKRSWHYCSSTVISLPVMTIT